LDTGKPDVEGTLKKRMRQCIIELNNLSKADVLFNQQFILDDQVRSDTYAYDVEQDTDLVSPTYGQIYITGSIVEPTLIAGTSKLGVWSLGNAQFPEQTVLKLMIEVSGKGYYPRMRFITRSENAFEINTISWAYRDMYAR